MSSSISIEQIFGKTLSQKQLEEFQSLLQSQLEKFKDKEGAFFIVLFPSSEDELIRQYLYLVSESGWVFERVKSSLQILSTIEISIFKPS